jgi:hypothetical protein
MRECDLEAREQWQWNDLEIMVIYESFSPFSLFL